MIWRNIKDIFYAERIMDTPIIQNINYTAADTTQKKAAISYITASYLEDWDKINIGRTQPKEISSIIKVISDLGYAIDIFGCNDLRAVEVLQHKKYDLIFGFGEAFYELTNKNPNALSVWYFTEHHPNFVYREERKRLDYFKERKNKEARVVRSGNFYKPHHLEKTYSNVITMSEIEPFLKEYSNPISFFPTGLKNPDFDITLQKNIDITKKNFLWFGSFGAIHKGLDILLDIFANRDDITLHIGGLSEEDRLLLNPKERDNIIDYGHINVMSKEFLDIVNKCSFTILPSSSEGCSTSITTCMRHGLIPIVNKDSGFNRLLKNAIFLEDYKVDYINDKLTEYSNYNSGELDILSKNIYEFANNTFTIKVFESKFKEIMQIIINKQDD
ncbi:glycosyltransferase [Zobellia laminariae]|uniref:glycosyltransferase n=1 Tax=Zobellia laminariae TaxID=248906 RepID=UPI0026F44204|nr:glycosyltransferase [Zobellia laminariae]WKX78335.1 glycosyltransferase [Zobellia laminariae]